MPFRGSWAELLSQSAATPDATRGPRTAISVALWEGAGIGDSRTAGFSVAPPRRPFPLGRNPGGHTCASAPGSSAAHRGGCSRCGGIRTGALYHVYRSTNSAITNAADFIRLTALPLETNVYVDASPVSGASVYMIRALASWPTGGGSYTNLSQASFVTNHSLDSVEFMVPEPASRLMLALGGALIGWIRWRRCSTIPAARPRAGFRPTRRRRPPAVPAEAGTTNWSERSGRPPTLERAPNGS
jgi:hypothetical protein